MLLFHIAAARPCVTGNHLTEFALLVDQAADLAVRAHCCASLALLIRTSIPGFRIHLCREHDPAGALSALRRNELTEGEVRARREPRLLDLYRTGTALRTDVPSTDISPDMLNLVIPL